MFVKLLNSKFQRPTNMKSSQGIGLQASHPATVGIPNSLWLGAFKGLWNQVVIKLNLINGDKLFSQSCLDYTTHKTFLQNTIWPKTLMRQWNLLVKNSVYGKFSSGDTQVEHNSKFGELISYTAYHPKSENHWWGPRLLTTEICSLFIY